MLLWYTVIIIERSPCNSNSPCAQTLRMEGVSNGIKRVPIQGRSWCVLQIFALSLCSHSKVSSCFYLLNCISSLGFVAGFAGYSLKHSTPVPLKVTFVLAVYMDVKAKWYLFSARHYGWASDHTSARNLSKQQSILGCEGEQKLLATQK